MFKGKRMCYWNTFSLELWLHGFQVKKAEMEFKSEGRVVEFLATAILLFFPISLSESGA